MIVFNVWTKTSQMILVSHFQRIHSEYKYDNGLCCLHKTSLGRNTSDVLVLLFPSLHAIDHTDNSQKIVPDVYVLICQEQFLFFFVFFFLFSWLSVIGQTDKKSHPLVKTIIGYKEQRGEKTYTYNSVIPFLVCLVCFMRLSERERESSFFLSPRYRYIYMCARLGRNSHLVGHFHLFFLDIKSYG